MISRKAIFYLILILLAVVFSGSLAALLGLDVVGAIPIILLFPIATVASWLMLFLILVFAVVIFRVGVKGALKNATHIPNAGEFTPFGIASVMLSFTFFTLLSLLPPEEALENLPIVNTLKMGELLRDLTSGASTPLLIVKFLILPVSGSLAIALIRIYRIIDYSWEITSPEDRNNGASGIVTALYFSVFVSFAILFVSSLFGAPSGYPLDLYFLTLFTIVLPASFIVSLIANYLTGVLEWALNGQSRKLASLVAVEILETVKERGEFLIDVTRKMDVYQWQVLFFLGVMTEPPLWTGGIRTYVKKKFKIGKMGLETIKEKASTIMEIQHDKTQRPLRTMRRM